MLVSLEGVAGESLLDNEQVNVSVSAGAQLGLEIEPDEFTFRAGAMSQELELELTAFLPLAVQMDDLQLQLLETVLPGTEERTTIPPSATLPVQVLREFTISFAMPDGTPLEITTPPDNTSRGVTTVQILIGGNRRVVLVLDNPELLGVGETFFFDLLPPLPRGRIDSGQNPEPGDVITLSTDLGSNVPLQTVSLGLIAGRVESDADNKEVLHTRVVPITLRVEFVPRRFRLSLSPAAGFSRTERPNEEIPDDTDRQSVRNFITVGDEITIESLAVRVEIRHPRIGDLRVLLVSPEGTVVALHDFVSDPAENLFETYTWLDHAGLAALVGAPAQGLWTLTVGDYVSGNIGTLEAWSLEINGFARVLAGGSVSLVASLSAIETPPLGVPRLFEGETLEVALAYDDGTGVALSEQMVTFDAESVPVDVTLDALFYATPGTLTAVADAISVSVNAEIAPAALPVEIVPRRFRLSLSGDDRFSRAVRPNELIPDDTGTQSVRSVITVEDEITIGSLAVRVEIRHTFIRDLRVFLVSPEGAMVALYDQASGFGFETNLFETYTSLDHAGLAALVGTPAQGEWTLSVGDYAPGETGTLEAWSLQIINTGVQVVLAGESVPVVVTLSGVDTPFGASRLFAGETLTVDWTYTDGVGVTLSPVVFDVTSPTSSIEAASILTATSAATAGVLEATFDAAAGLANAEIDPAVVPVQLIRRFRLAFAPATTARVLAGGTTEVMVVLENSNVLMEDEQLRISLQPTTVTVIPSELTLTSTMLQAPFTIEARHDAVPPLGMVVASGEVLSGDAPVAYTQVLSTTLAVEIAPRRFLLAVLEKDGARIDFKYVVAGGSTEVVVSISGVRTPLGRGRLDVSETLQVDFVYTGGEGVTLSPVSFNEDALFTSAPATVDAGEGATSGVLRLTGSGLVNADVAPVTLRVEVLPNEFRLVFEPPQIGILTGTEETVVLSLTDASRLPAEDEVLVELLLDDASTVSVMSPTTLSFNASATSHVVVLSAAADTSPGATVLVASVEMSPASLAGVRFVGAGLPVSIVGEREFEWVFRSPQGERLSTAGVVAGASTQLLVSLEGVSGERLFEGEQVDVTLAPVSGAVLSAVFPETASIQRGSPQAIVLTAFPDADRGGIDELQVQLTQTIPTELVDSVTIPPSTTLPVRAFSGLVLSFATPEGVARVLAGGTTEVVVALENPGLLEMSEVVRVSLSTEIVVAVPSSLTLTATTPRATFTIEARHDADPPEGMVLASGRVMSGEERVAYTRVVSTTLSVEIVPRRFRLSLSPLSPLGQFSATVRPNEAITDATETQSVRSVITVEDEITVGSLTVQVEIRHSFIGDLRVLLVSPEGAMVTLYRQLGNPVENLFETYTSLDHAGLATLVGTPAQGEWTLTVGDYIFQDTGTLEAWSLEISEFAPVLAGGSAAVTASLVAVETPLGTPRLFADETLAVALAYNDGTGVALSESLVTFNAESTAVGVTLDAAPDATPGRLTAVVAGAVPVNAEIAPAALPMRIAPRRFRLSLSPGAPPGQFSATVRPNEMIHTGTQDCGQQHYRGRVHHDQIAGGAGRDQRRGSLVLLVRLRSPGGADVLLHGLTGGTELGFERAYTSRDHAGLAALAGESAQGEWTLMVTDFSSWWS